MKIILGDRARFKYVQMSRSGRHGRLVAVRCVRPKAVEEDRDRGAMAPEAHHRPRGAKDAQLAPSLSG